MSEISFYVFVIIILYFPYLITIIITYFIFRVNGRVNVLSHSLSRVWHKTIVRNIWVLFFRVWFKDNWRTIRISSSHSLSWRTITWTFAGLVPNALRDKFSKADVLSVLSLSYCDINCWSDVPPLWITIIVSVTVVNSWKLKFFLFEIHVSFTISDWIFISHLRSE